MKWISPLAGQIPYIGLDAGQVYGRSDTQSNHQTLDKGMGVNNLGVIEATKDLQITNAVHIVNSSTMKSKNIYIADEKHTPLTEGLKIENLKGATIVSSGYTELRASSIANNGLISSTGHTDLYGTLNNGGEIYSKKSLLLSSDNVKNTGIIITHRDLYITDVKKMDNNEGAVVAERIRSYSFSPVQPENINGTVNIEK